MTEAPLPVGELIAKAARFDRLYGICRRLRWSEYGVPSTDSEQSREALIDLCEFLFMDGIDAALDARSLPRGDA